MKSTRAPIHPSRSQPTGTEGIRTTTARRKRSLGRSVLAAIAMVAILAGCDSLQPDKTSLIAPTSGTQERPRCDACHGMGPRTGAHRFHLDTLRAMNMDQHITCMDCHAASIAFSQAPIQDTIYFNPDPLKPSFHSANFPWQKFDRTGAFEVVTVDSMPVAVAEREAGAENPAWMTKGSSSKSIPGHANGTVDVVFAERNANWTDGQGVVRRASWNAGRLSCNAVACHGSQAADTAKYVWKDPAK